MPCLSSSIIITSGQRLFITAKWMVDVTFFRGLNKEHLQWLQAIADRAACGLIAAEGSSLFSEENATAVKKSFPDVIACLAKAQEDEEDNAQPFEPESPNE